MQAKDGLYPHCNLRKSFQKARKWNEMLRLTYPGGWRGDRDWFMSSESFILEMN